MRIVTLMLVATLTGGCAGRHAAPAVDSFRYEYQQKKLGAVYEIILYAPDKPQAEAAATAAYARVDELNAILSNYDPQSEISRLNAMAFDGPMPSGVPVSRELYDVIAASLEASRQTDGVFDITVGPLVQLWKRSGRQGILPTPERIAEARKAVGWQKVRLDPNHQTVQLLAGRMVLDVSGIAVGYINEEVMKVLRKQGISSAFIDAGGDLLASDAPPGKECWVVAIQSPTQADQTMKQAIGLHNGACTTSGDTYRFVEIDGVRYSHIIDTRTGLGATNRCSATVVAGDGVTATWMATSLCVLGADGLQGVAKVPGTAARITLVHGETVQVLDSASFAGHLVEEKLDNANKSIESR